MRKMTFVFTLFAVLLCLFHYLGFDPKNMLLFSFSVPLWFVVIFSADIRNIPLLVAYTLTIGFWILLGYLIDLWVVKHRRTRN